MKKFLFASLILVISCFFVGCKDSKEPSVDNIESIVVCSEFNNETFYINDVVELKGYTVLVTYESGITETLKLSSFGLSILDTTSAGEKTLNFSYKEKDFTINYTVLNILPISAMYKGNAIEFYRGETFDLSSIKVSILFNNGDERNLSLTEFTLTEIDYSLSSETKTFTASYEGVSVTISYTVTNRPIIEGVDYNFNDSLNLFDDSGVKIRFIEDMFILHDNDSENREVILSQQANKDVFNKYWTIAIYNNAPTKIYFYLVKDTIYCEL